jgi:hypothetical protein
MLVSHKYKFIFIKTIKTAGTSTEIFLEPYCIKSLEESHARTMIKTSEGIVGTRMSQTKAKNSEFYNHMTPKEVKEKLGNDIFDSYLKIANIRNPFDILVSHYYFKPTYNLFTKENLSFKEYLLKTDVVEVLANKYKEFLFIDDKFIIDEIIRFENLESDLENLLKKLDLPKTDRKLSNYKLSKERAGMSYQTFYDEETIQKVESIFDFYIKLFDYKF